MRYHWNELQQLATDCFVAVGVPPEDAAWCSEVLVRADLTGVQTHGLSRLAAYIRAIQRGIINPRPHFTWKKGAAAVSTLDGDSGLGPVLGRAAMLEAIKLADQAGIGMVTVRRGNHAGIMSAYVDLAVQAGMIGWAFSNAQPAISPWGGSKAFFGTNPIAFGSPCQAHTPVIIDLATSKVARGNIILAAKTGDPIPDDWAVDEFGRPTTDAAAALRGAVLPMAGAKGYALALMVEILTGVLAGAQMAPHVGSVYEKESRVPGTGLCFIAINPTPFLGSDDFLSRMDQLVDGIHQVPPADGCSSVRVPGERRIHAERTARQTGVFLEESTLLELNQLALEFGISWRG
ncbi:Ldh family oxidoreductase [Effusibacillus dendaii]|uniref:Lactate dehydrogenase n=1 Tax=Effusibacillus dendaii TaxID=2743772 RepID=A0A7I8DAQ2_9BACL|nr:Ldh family oxidoreductase [Effusibacillus dendaii]BCJ85600.1 lactate dehydrogenase [Effusibacillus dendaii]